MNKRFITALAAVLIITTVLGLLAGLIAIFPIVLGVIAYRYAKRAVLRAIVSVKANRKTIRARARVIALMPLVPFVAMLNGAVSAFKDTRRSFATEWRDAKVAWQRQHA